MERQSLYERFKLLNWQQQVGNIASTLAMQILHLAIDWCVPNVPQQFFHRFVDYGQQLCRETN